MFIPQGATLTFGEIDPEKKHRVSHRAHAFARLVEHRFSDR
jgi:XTP/dITP diphosphohydrolase